MAETGEAVAQVGHQRPLAAEEMGAARDIEPEPIGAVDGDQGRIAAAPIGEPRERRRIAGAVGREDGEIGPERPGIGQRQAGQDALGRRGAIGRHDEEPAAELLDGDRGLTPGKIGLAAQPIRRPARQPQGDDPFHPLSPESRLPAGRRAGAGARHASCDWAPPRPASAARRC